jgi:hypothetical protein
MKRILSPILSLLLLATTALSETPDPNQSVISFFEKSTQYICLKRGSFHKYVVCLATPKYQHFLWIEEALISTPQDKHGDYDLGTNAYIILEENSPHMILHSPYHNVLATIMTYDYSIIADILRRYDVTPIVE